MASLTIGKYVNNVATLVLRASDKLSGDGTDYYVSVPNAVGFPNKTRCLAMVQKVLLYPCDKHADDDVPIMLGVEIDQMAARNQFYTQNTGDSRLSSRSIIGYVTPTGSFVTDTVVTAFGNSCDGDILTHGVDCQSPFGKTLRVRLLNMGEGNPAPIVGKDNDYKDFQSIVVLRLLFIDNEDTIDGA